MKVLAFDQSTTACGWALMEGGKIIDSGIFKPVRKVSIDERIYSVASFVKKAMATYKPDLAVFENTQDQKSPATLIHLSKLLGACIYQALDFEVAYNVVSPSSWRAVFGIGARDEHGNTPKRDELKLRAMAIANEQYGYEAEEDECEAILMAASIQQVRIRALEIAEKLQKKKAKNARARKAKI